MSRFLAITHDITSGPLGLTLVSGSALIQRHADACAPGLWAIRHFELSNHRTTPTANAVVDDFGTLQEVTQ